MVQGHEPVFLSTQYRCHPAIGQLSGSLFYDGHLRNGVTATERSPAVHWLPTLALYNVSGQEQLTRDGSWQNDAETKLVVKLVEALVDDGVPGSHIGVITPYRAQVQQISNHLVSVLAYCPDMARSVLVSTVDAFQGGERDAVIVSCVRTCVQGARDETRRVTVALTRAKRHLAIIACIAGLKPSPLWGKVIQYCQGKGFCEHLAQEPERQHKWRKRKKDKGVFQVS
uniref:DNA2/NAM7 helicase-like C-terminal domain-containing protein n=1 Tax=Eptatretus burgeri TaxID=7764 RepID=A0A8C4X0Z1_EPTBU